MEPYVVGVGWATVLGAFLFVCGFVWYYALFWLFNAIKNTSAMAKFVRMYVISKHRERRREKEKYIKETLLARDSRITTTDY